MDEQTLNNQQQVTPTATQAAATPAAQQTTPLQSSVTAQPAENLPAGVSDYSAQIAQMYDAQMAAKQQSMEDAYNQNMTTMQRAREQIAPTYFNQGNDLATQYERTRRNNNMRADMNGLNTGTASQMDLAQQSNYLDAFGQIRTAQANAERQADQQIADLEVAYKSQVAQALADNDYQKATALLQEYQRRDNAAEEMRRYNQEQAMADAKLRAAYGDFGGFASLYGQGTADAMQKYWAMNNPDYAYAMGLISAAEYQAMTGMAPGGYSSGYSSGGGGGSYYRRSSSSSSNDDNGPGTYDPNSPNGPSTVEPTVSDSDKFDASYYEYLDVMGSEKRAYEQMMKDREKEVKAALGQDAAAAGLTPGSNAYNNYVNDRANDALLNDQWYKAAKDGYNDYAAQAEARAQARANEAKKEQAINAVAQGLNAQNSVTNAEVAFWQRVFGGGSNSSNTSSGNKGGSTTNKTTTNKTTTNKTTVTKPSTTKKTTSSAQTISGKQRAKL